MKSLGKEQYSKQVESEKAKRKRRKQRQEKAFRAQTERDEDTSQTRGGNSPKLDKNHTLGSKHESTFQISESGNGKRRRQIGEQSVKRTRNRKSGQKETERPAYAFEVDETDHCETPLEAYRDLLVVLDKIAASVGKTRGTLLIYDPYFCNGGVERKLKSLGFSNVINRNRDFYQDIANKSTPSYDVLITNPPYSGIHMEKLLSFCIQRDGPARKPFILLLPHYVYTKEYYSRALGSSSSDLYFLIPETRYSYVPPKWVTSADGSRALSRGKEKTAPFPSFWYCGVQEKMVSNSWLVDTFGPSGAFRPKGSSKLRYANCSKDIPRDFKGEFDVTKKRPNPKARKRAAKKRRQALLGI